jgi:hypothetical protein
VSDSDRIKSLAIDDGYRIIKIRDGDRVEKVPVIQAILLKLAVAAANGNTRAQQTLGINQPAPGPIVGVGLGYLTLGGGFYAARRWRAARKTGKN